MNRVRALSPLHLVALAALIAGLTSTVWAFGRVAGARRALKAKVEVVAKLGAARSDLARYEAAKADYEKRAGPPLPSLTDLLAKTPGLPPPEQRGEPPREIAPGWIVRRQEVAFANAPLDRLIAWVAAAEALDPPWRLVKIELRGGPQPGHARAVLSLEGLERASVSPAAP
jgi:hypothetical protein